jgi:hypothetical protein
MKEIIVAIIAGGATVLGAWISSTRKRKPNQPDQPKTPDRLTRYVAFFAAGTVIAFAFMVALREQVPGLGDNFPVGTVVAYMGNAAPDGWLLCDGTDVPAQCRELIKVIGPKKPNMQGRFLRGLDPTGTVDPDGKTRALGSPQEDELKHHTHTCDGMKIIDAERGMNIDYGGKRQLPGVTIGETGGAETRPKNSAVNFIIKY